jgi:hypothetical protein
MIAVRSTPMGCGATTQRGPLGFETDRKNLVASASAVRFLKELEHRKSLELPALHVIPMLICLAVATTWSPLPPPGTAR